MPIKNLHKYLIISGNNGSKNILFACLKALSCVIFLIFIFGNNSTAIFSPNANDISPLPADESQQPEKSLDDKFKYLGWWGNINYNKTGIYKKPTRESEFLGIFTKINRVKILEEVAGEMVGENNLWYKIDGGAYPGAYIFSADVTPIEQPAPPANPKIPAGVKNGEYWVDVDLTKKILTLFLYDYPIFATYVATGVATHSTPTGTYKIVSKFEKARMKGRPPVAARVYDLPNVPYVMYYRGSFSLHGTYWHDKFGSRQSSGCTNLTQGDAKFIFERIKPLSLFESKNFVFSSKENPGTIIYNHY